MEALVSRRCVIRFRQLLIVAAHVSAISCPAFGQGTLDAVSYSSNRTAAYTPSGGVGWSFVPNADLLVTAISSTAPQVNFWLGSNNVIASYAYAGPRDVLVTNFQNVAPLVLSAGQKYFVSTQYSNFSAPVIFFVFGVPGNPDGAPPFSVSPHISGFASYYLSPSGQWSSTTTPASANVNYVFLGPNFQYEVVPEPAVYELWLSSGMLLACRIKRALRRERNL